MRKRYVLSVVWSLSLAAGAQVVSSGGSSGPVTINGATTPATNAPLCGGGSANSVVPCVSGTDYAPVVNSVVPFANLPASLPSDAAAAQAAGATAATAVNTAGVAALLSTSTAAASLIGQHQAGALSFLDYGGVCDAQVTFTLDTATGRIVSTSYTGTDNTVAYAAFLTAGGSTVTATDHVPLPPMGLVIDGGVPNGSGGQHGNLGSIPQQTLRLPPNCRFLISSAPITPEGVNLDMNNSDMNVTGPNPGIFDVDRQANHMNGRHEQSYRNGRVTYVGPQWNATTASFVGVYLEAGQQYADNIGVYNWPIGFAAAVSEYGEYHNIKASNNRVGIYPFGANVPLVAQGGSGYPSGPGSPQIDDNWYNTVSRNNDVNYWLEDALAQNFYGGSASYAYVAPIVLGDVLPHWIGSVTTSAPANGAAISCTANATVKLATVDSGGGVQAELVYLVNAAGNGGSAYSIRGGKGYTTAANITVTAPTTGSASCANPPKFAAVVNNMDNWGLYQSGGQNVGATQNHFYDFNLEAFSYAGHPSFGVGIYGDSNSASNIVHGFTFLTDSGDPGFTFFAEFDGGSNFISRTTGTGATDPWDGTSCSYLAAVPVSVEANMDNSVAHPENSTCYTFSKHYASDGAASFEGWDGGQRVAAGFEAVTSNGYSPYFSGFGTNAVTGVRNPFRSVSAQGSGLFLGSGQSAPDFGFVWSSAGQGSITGQLTNLPLNYNGGVVGSGMITNQRSPLMAFWDTTGNGDFATAEEGEEYGSDGKLHKVHYTCANGAYGATPNGCVKDFDAGPSGVTVPTLTGPGNAYACINALGALYRSPTPCQ